MKTIIMQLKFSKKDKGIQCSNMCERLTCKRIGIYTYHQNKNMKNILLLGQY